MIQIIKYKVYKPVGEDKEEFIERITDNLDMFVHKRTDDLSILVTYDKEEETLEVKTLRLNEYAN